MRICRFLTFASILIFAPGTARASDISVYFSPPSSSQAVGSSFTINILADIPQIPGNPGLVDFGFNLLWDQSMMQLNGVGGTGSPFDLLWDSGRPESITGFLFPTPTSPASEWGSGILLASLDFRCLQEGSSNLGIALDPTLFADGAQGFYDPDTDGTGGLSLDWAATEGSVTQENVVPEPCTIVLLSTGLTGLAFDRGPLSIGPRIRNPEWMRPGPTAVTTAKPRRQVPSGSRDPGSGVVVTINGVNIRALVLLVRCISVFQPRQVVHRVMEETGISNLRLLALCFLLPGLAGLMPDPPSMRMTPRLIHDVTVYQTAAEDRRMDMIECSFTTVFVIGLGLSLVHLRKWAIARAIEGEVGD